MSIRREAHDASVDFIVAHGEAPLTRNQAFVAGYLAAARSRDQRIEELEERIERFTRDVLRTGHP